MNEIIEDLVKIYLSITDSYNSKICQTLNDKYTIIDKSMVAVYLFVKIIEDRNEKNKEATYVLSNYLLRQVIYSETGNIAFEISDKSKISIYQKMLDKLILEKFDYKNRIMQKLKYDYKDIEINVYSDLLMFLEDIAEFAIFQRMVLKGNKMAATVLENIKGKINDELKMLDSNDYFYSEKKDIINLITADKFNESQYGNLVYVVLNLKDVNRYSQVITRISRKCITSSV